METRRGAVGGAVSCGKGGTATGSDGERGDDGEGYEGTGALGRGKGYVGRGIGEKVGRGKNVGRPSPETAAEVSRLIGTA